MSSLSDRRPEFLFSSSSVNILLILTALQLLHSKSDSALARCTGLDGFLKVMAGNFQNA